MPSYYHLPSPSVNDSERIFDEALGDYVFTNMGMFLLTVDQDTGQKYNSLRFFPLPPPEADKFIPSLQVTDEVAMNWLALYGDGIAMQDYNVDKIEKIYAGEHVE